LKAGRVMRRVGNPAGDAYFVGRRLSDATEIFEVTANEVQRLRSERRYGERVLDWHGTSRAGMELSHTLLSQVVDLRPSRDLEERFALYVLADLPDEGFVMDAAEVRRWLLLASDPRDFADAQHARHAWTGRLRTLFRGREVQSAHD
jgi:hypothetical protein